MRSEDQTHNFLNNQYWVIRETRSKVKREKIKKSPANITKNKLTLRSVFWEFRLIVLILVNLNAIRIWNFLELRVES